MGDVIYKKFRAYCIDIGMLVSCLCIITIVLVHFYLDNSKIDEEKVRVDCNNLVYQLEKQISLVNIDDVLDAQDSFQVETNMTYSIVDLTGVIQFSTIPRYKVKEKMNLHKFGIIKESDAEYRIPLSKDGVQCYFAIIAIDPSEYSIPKLKQKVLLYGAAGLLLMGVFSLLNRIRRFLKQDIIMPVEQIHTTTNAIMQGDYSKQVLYDYDGEIGGLCHDFELMRSELKEYYEREKLYKKKETLLLASISHDLKTPLATVCNYVEGILYDVVETKEEIKEYAVVIHNKMTYLNGLIDDILEHSKAELNQFRIMKEDVYADEFFEPILQVLKQEVNKKNFEFSYDSFPQIILTIDPKRITQVLYNLVDNAVKYGRPCGFIHITNQIIKKNSSGALETYLLVCVEDNGIGISAADLPYVFETFYRGDKARNQDIPGSGLGLNIARYIVRSHGGDIDCDSVYEIGTTMSFTIKI